MKELSIEQKAKRYDDAFKEASVAHIDEDRHLKATLERIFPELKELENEKIRKEIISMSNTLGRKDWVAWLEKQGEQKPVGFNIGDEITVNGQVCSVVAVDNLAWSEEDEERLDIIFERIERGLIVDKDDIDRLKSLKDRVQPQPKQEWSALDERNLQGIIDEIQANKNKAPDYDIVTYDRFLNWLKSLRPQNRWKPSDEQMNALNDVISSRDIKYDVLSELWKDLKKLRGE